MQSELDFFEQSANADVSKGDELPKKHNSGDN